MNARWIGRHRGLLAVGLAVLFFGAAWGYLRQKPPRGSAHKAWTEYPGNPIIKIGRTLPYTMWNDPTVLREGATYRMWLSGGDLRNLKRIVVKIYTATSNDGVSWKIDPKAVLSPPVGTSAWDNLRIETPSVIKVKGVYHMYYSGAAEKEADLAMYSIGHATSPDGIVWTRDPANPIITTQKKDKFQWAYDMIGGVAEPGAVFNPKDGKIYLYYAAMQTSRAEPSHVYSGVLLATSTDGSHFTHYVDANGERQLILRRDVPHAIKGAWFGYSTPSAVILSSGEFHLFADFLVAPVGPRSARQVAIDHAVSADGLHFKVIEQDIFHSDQGDWKDHRVGSPAAIEANGRLELWFAGETKRPVFGAGIGFASRVLP